MIEAVNELAVLVAAASVGFAAGIAVFMMTLIWRRYRSERRDLSDRAAQLEVSRELLTAIGGADLAEMPAFAAASPGSCLAAVSHLLQLLRGGDRDRLLRIAEEKGLFDAALARLRHRRPERRIDAMRLLEQFASPACVDGLTNALANDALPAVRLEAAGALARMGRLPPVGDVVVMLDLTRQMLTRLHRALFRSLAARDFQPMMALAETPALVRLRPLLVDALGWSEDFGVLPALERHALDVHPEVRCAALRAARKLGHPAASTWVVARLADDQEIVRIQAAQTCGALGLVVARPVLEALRHDQSWWVRMRASAALNDLPALSRGGVS